MEKLLEEVERVMYFSSCAVTLAQYADFDRFGSEIDCVLQTVAEMTDTTRQKVTEQLILMHMSKKKAEV